MTAAAISRLRTPALGVSLLLLTLYLPLAAMVYLPGWYHLNCDWHGRCARLGEPLALASIDNLTAFFAHRAELNSNWSAKERAHLTEVRSIYDGLAATALAALLLAWACFDPRRVRAATLTNTAIILCLLLLLPGFGYFWRHIFHELLFSNELWKTDRGDLTWYLTPRSLFRNAVIVLVVAGAGLNLALAGAATWWQRRQRPPESSTRHP